jgi:hypothetical protein
LVMAIYLKVNIFGGVLHLQEVGSRVSIRPRSRACPA